MSANLPRNHLMMKKNETSHFELTFIHSDAQALAASLVTECDFTCNDNLITVSESAESVVDLRARWNSLMRGLIASEHALNATGED